MQLFQGHISRAGDRNRTKVSESLLQLSLCAAKRDSLDRNLRCVAQVSPYSRRLERHSEAEQGEA